MKKRENRQKWVRLLAMILAALMVFSMVLSVLVSALAEENPEKNSAARNTNDVHIEYLEDNQALLITQRLIYHNESNHVLNNVVFNAIANMFRRESALMYESDVLESVFPHGFAPAGIDLTRVQCNGVDVDWGYQGENEMNLRVACDLEPGESCVFEFEYYILLSSSFAMIGVSETDIRLHAFLLSPAIYSESACSFISYSPLQFTQWLYTTAADYNVTLVLPDQYLVAATGNETLVHSENHISTWEIHAENVRDFALSFGRRYRENIRETESGVQIRVFSNDRSAAAEAVKYAAEIINLYEEWFGTFPISQIDLVQSDYPIDALPLPGTIWIPSDLMSDSDEFKRALRVGLAKQYFGYAAYAEPVADAWLSDVICEYVELLAVEELQGYNTFVGALNEKVLDALRITIPGGLYITASAELFTANEYDIVVCRRGTVVMHEMRVAMGRSDLLAGLRNFYEMGLERDLLVEMDLVTAFDRATNGDWEDFLTDWLFNVDDYIDQQIDYYE